MATETQTQDPSKGPEHIRQSNVVEKLIRSPLFWVLFLIFGFSYPVYRSIYRVLPPELPILATVPEYELINENGQRFGSKDLEGRVYLANFIFTRCPTVCPKLTKEMEKIQKRMKGLGQKVAIVTFTVDPKFDNEKVLFDYARKIHANPYVWTFLTGSNDKQELFKLYREGFKVPVENDGSENLMTIAHAEKIVLVDTMNRIRGYYNYDENSINKLMIDVGLLINRPPTKE